MPLFDPSIKPYINNMLSAGLLSGGAITDVGSGNVSVSGGIAILRVANDLVSSLVVVNFSTTVLAVPNDNVQHYIGLNYNNGSPVVEMHSTDDWSGESTISLGAAQNLVALNFVSNNPMLVSDSIRAIIRRLSSITPANRDVQVGGLAIGETGTRNITISPGAVWARLNPYVITSKDTSGSDTMSAGYVTNGTWTFPQGLTQWPNTEYNDPTLGLVTMTNNRYANLWFYVTFESNIFGFLYGQAQYNSIADALAEAPIAALPPGTSTSSLLLGRITFQKSAATAASIEQAFDIQFTGSSVSNHNDLSGLQGGTISEYYHLTSAQYSGITSLPTITGSRSSGAALTNLLSALATMGLITNSTTA